jgi:RNA polymerase sigma factor (TIGR02999 family)
MARRQLARAHRGVTLGATSLLHEAYMEMAQREAAVFPDRGRFFAYASKVMRGIIIDYARSRKAQKRGGGFAITELAGDVPDGAADASELEEISEAVDRLGKADAPLAQLVDLKFFCGFTFAEIAALRGVTERTVQRHWEKARIYLHREISASQV